MVRKATEQDISRIAEITVYSWRTAYRGIMSDEFLFNKRSVIETSKNILARFNDPQFDIDVYDDGIIKGFAIHHPAEDEDLAYAYDLMSLYVEPQFKGLGIGSELIQSVEKQAKDKDFKSMVIWTLEKNESAIAFYEKHSYLQDGIKEHRDIWGADIIRLVKEIR